MVLDFIRKSAPHIADLQGHVDDVFRTHGIEPGHHQAAVTVALDNSASTDLPPNQLWSKGIMQQLVDLIFAAGWTLDDDQTIPVSVFDSRVTNLGLITPDTCHGCLDNRPKQNITHRTSYLSVLRWIVQTAGFGHVNLGDGTQPLTVKATAPYPTFAIVMSDGNSCESLRNIAPYVRAMSQLPIFVQFVGVGRDICSVLPGIDTMPGRLVDNANYFHAGRVHNEGEMLSKMLGEFPTFYAAATEAGLITG